MGVENNIPEGWMETTLGDLVERITKGTTPKIFSSEKNDVNYIKSDALNYSGFLDNGRFVKISNETNNKLKRSQLKVDDILLSMAGEKLGKTGIIKEQHLPANTNQAVAIITVNKKRVGYKFIWYKLRNKNTVKYFKTIPSQSAQPNINFQEIRSLPINLPTLPEQKSIAKVLTAFDDKIELLQAQNKTLETMAQTIFKEWFGKYQIGDELPEGWRVGKLGDIAKHVKNNIKPFNNPNKLYHHYSLPAYDDGLRPVNELGSDIKSNKYSVENNSFLVSKLNPFTPRIWTIFNSEDVNICSTEFQVVKPNEDNLFSIVHCLLNSKYFTDNLSQKIKGTSSSHQRVNPEDIFEVDLVIPNKEDLIRFEKLVIPMITKKDINHNNIQSLTKTRDTLLPKLMSGQVRVNNLKQTADA